MSKGRYGLKNFSDKPWYSTIQPPLDPLLADIPRNSAVTIIEKLAVIDRFQGIRSLKSVA